MEGWDDNYVDGQHQLELNRDEKDMPPLARAFFDKVVVLINASTAMELGELEEDGGVDAILWVGSPGQTGFNAVGAVLAGGESLRPHRGYLPADYTRDPAFVNFGDYKLLRYQQAERLGRRCFVQYEEGIYVGYRYYETAAAEGFIDYDEAVVYPFGYGLSYTDFTWEVAGSRLGGVDGSLEVDVTVTNTAPRPVGRGPALLHRALQQGRHREGGGGPGRLRQDRPSGARVETVTLTIPVEDMASYDYLTNRAYVLEAGDYILSPAATPTP